MVAVPGAACRDVLLLISHLLSLPLTALSKARPGREAFGSRSTCARRDGWKYQHLWATHWFISRQGSARGTDTSVQTQPLQLLLPPPMLPTTVLHSSFCSIFCFVCLFVLSLGPHLRHMEVPGLGVESELQLLAHPTATAMLDSSHICNLHRSLQQNHIFNPLSETKDQT